jgi:hypothetical protein
MDRWDPEKTILSSLFLQSEGYFLDYAPFVNSYSEISSLVQKLMEVWRLWCVMILSQGVLLAEERFSSLDDGAAKAPSCCGQVFGRFSHHACSAHSSIFSFAERACQGHFCRSSRLCRFEEIFVLFCLGGFKNFCRTESGLNKKSTSLSPFCFPFFL